MITVEEIASIYSTLRSNNIEEKQRIKRIRNTYKGNIVVNVPEFKDAGIKPIVANLLAISIDQMATRLTSTEPEPIFLPRKRGIDRYEKGAASKKNAILSFWEN